MTSTHEINADLQKLTTQYHGGVLDTADYRAKRRAVLDALVRTNPKAPKATPRTRRVKKAKYIGFFLILISLVALALFGFKFH